MRPNVETVRKKGTIGEDTSISETERHGTTWEPFNWREVRCGSHPIRYNPIISYRARDAIKNEKQLYVFAVVVAASRLDLWNFNERNYAEKTQKISIKSPKTFNSKIRWMMTETSSPSVNVNTFWLDFSLLFVAIALIKITKRAMNMKCAGNIQRMHSL